MIEEFYNDYQPGHSKFQIENFILYMNGRTPYGQYKQALRELFPRFKNILDSILNIEKLEDEIENFKPDKSTPRKENISNLELDRKKVNLKMNKDSLNQQMKEFKNFYSIASQIKTILGVMTDEQINIYEEEYWSSTFKEKMAIEMLGTGRISQSTIEAILCMPERMDMLAHMKDIQTNPFQYLNQLPNNRYNPGTLLTNQEVLDMVKNQELRALVQPMEPLA